MNRGITNHLLVFAFYAITIFFVTFPNPSKSQPFLLGQNVTFGMTISEMMERFKGSDPSNYGHVTLGLYNHGTVTKAQVWALNFWPPGLPFLESLLLRFFGINHPFILSMILTTICIWSVVLMLLYSILRMRINQYLALLLPLCVLAFDDFILFAFQSGAILSDSISCAFFCGSFLVMIINAKSHRTRLLMSIISGLLMACAALTRVTYELVGNFLLIGSMLALFVKVSRLIKAKAMYPGNLKIVIRSQAGYILIAAIVFSIALIPYKLHYMSLTGEYALTAKSSHIWVLQWMTDERLVEAAGGHGFISAGLGGMACRVEPDVCKSINAFENSTKTPFHNARKFDDYRRLALKTFFFNPYKWMKIKLSRFHLYWFPNLIFTPPGKIELLSYLNIGFRSLANLALLFFSVFILTIQFLRFVNYRAIVMSYYYLAFLGGCLLPLFIIHYEARYFYPIKMVGIIFTLSLISLIPKFSEEKNALFQISKRLILRLLTRTKKI